MKGHQEIVQLLIAYGASLNAKSVKGFTPLHWAAHNNRANIVYLLIESGK